ncbi:phosphoglycolate/pyridoxal phosphate family phosphatase [Candidatus Micrarchaeota archaeon]|nr:phosphoglycolate/pyridoxal phosphate family phosphatase [Candidatus Micrarchaeota archaeon]
MIKGVIFDLDGTLYRGKKVIDGAAETLERLRNSGVKVLFLTNAATKSRENVAQKLTNMGLQANKEEVYSSSYFLARYISSKHKGKKVFVVGEQGILDEFREAKVECVEERADIVVVGLDRKFTYEKLAHALAELRDGAILIASNKDPTFPTENSFMPGAGSIVAAIETASGKEARVVGKPNCYPLELIKEDYGLKNEETVVVGDRLDTDIKFANCCGIKSVLVLSGVNKKSDIKKDIPDYILSSVAEFNLPLYP